MMTRITAQNRPQQNNPNFKGAIKILDHRGELVTVVKNLAKDNVSLKGNGYFTTLFPPGSPLEKQALAHIDKYQMRFIHYDAPNITMEDLEKLHKFMKLG